MLYTKNLCQKKNYVIFTFKYMAGKYDCSNISSCYVGKKFIKTGRDLVKCFEEKNEYFYLFTKANADASGEEINEYLAENIKSLKNARLVDSLGRLGYLSALKYSVMMIGNSSSGIYEAPIFKIPTINIGNRQKGRVHGDTVIDCEAEEDAITLAF